MFRLLQPGLMGMWLRLLGRPLLWCLAGCWGRKGASARPRLSLPPRLWGALYQTLVFLAAYVKGSYQQWLRKAANTLEDHYSFEA